MKYPRISMKKSGTVTYIELLPKELILHYGDCYIIKKIKTIPEYLTVIMLIEHRSFSLDDIAMLVEGDDVDLKDTNVRTNANNHAKGIKKVAEEWDLPFLRQKGKISFPGVKVDLGVLEELIEEGNLLKLLEKFENNNPPLLGAYKIFRRSFMTDYISPIRQRLIRIHEEAVEKQTELKSLEDAMRNESCNPVIYLKYMYLAFSRGYFDLVLYTFELYKKRQSTGDLAEDERVDVLVKKIVSSINELKRMKQLLDQEYNVLVDLN